MLVTSSRFIGTTVLSVQAGGPIASVSDIIVDPDNLKIIGLKLSGPLVRGANILDINSVREYSEYGMVIDGIDELVAPGDVIKIEKVLSLNFNLIGLKVETKKHTKLGHIIDYTLDPNAFIVRQIIVKRPLIKSFVDPELTISRNEIIEVNDYKIIVKDEEKTLKSRAEHEDFIPNFVNPFRKSEQAPSPAETKTLDERDS